MRSRVLAVSCLLVVLAGCTTTNDIMQAWVGSTPHELILKWGPPTRAAPDGADGYIMIYEFTARGQVPGQAYTVGGVVYYTAPQTSERVSTRMFYVNAEGSIYSWRWEDR